MQILITWKAANLSPEEAAHRWTSLLKSWHTRYQALIPSIPLHASSTSEETLFCGQIAIPSLFREWEAWYEDASWGLAWNGLAHNLLDLLPPAPGLSLSQRFLQMRESHSADWRQELEGRFVVAVLDKRQQRLDVSTNALGLTPCFRTEGTYGIAVGTRIAPLLDLVGRSVAPNRSGLVQVVGMDWCISDDTTFEGVFQVNAGTTITVDHHTSSFRQERSVQPEHFIERSRELRKADYLTIGSEAMMTTVAQQLRHASAPLFDLTGGFDSRSIVSTAVALGHHPDCDVTGLPDSSEIRIASRVAETLEVSLRQIHPQQDQAESLEEVFRLWGLWTEGMSPAHIAFSQSLMSLSPSSRDFFAPYRQVFNGGVFFSLTFLYNTEILVRAYSPEQIAAKICSRVSSRYRAALISPADTHYIEHPVRSTLDDGVRLGLKGHHLFDFFYCWQRGSRWTGYMTDMQQIGRHLFTPLCTQRLLEVSFAMRVEELLQGAWYYAHLRRVAPTALTVPFLKDAPLSGYRQQLLNIHPKLFQLAWHAKMAFHRPKRRTLPLDDYEKIGARFHPYLERFLFHKQAYWPEIIPYQAGRIAWANFVKGLEAKPLWNLVTLEIWAKTFL